MAKKILALFPEHREYVEPYFGGGSVFFAKPPALVETINDLDSGVMGFFRVLHDQPEEFIRLAELTPYSRELWRECRDLWRTEEDPVRRAWRWWVVARQSFSGNQGGSWSMAVTASSRGQSMRTSGFLSAVAGLPAVVERLRATQIENNDALKVLRQYCTASSLAYCDPPYVAATRRAGGYDHETDDQHHHDLVDLLLTLSGRFVLSGYASAIYLPLEQAGWGRVDWDVVCHAAGRTRVSKLQGTGTGLTHQKRVESAWLDPVTTEEQHTQHALGL